MRPPVFIPAYDCFCLLADGRRQTVRVLSGRAPATGLEVTGGQDHAMQVPNPAGFGSAVRLRGGVVFQEQLQRSVSTKCTVLVGRQVRACNER